MVRRDLNTLDLTQQSIRIADDVMFWPVRERGELVYRMEIPKLHRFFRVGYEEYVFLSLLDGKTTIPQACGLAAAMLGNRAPTASQAGVIGRWLLNNELAYLEADGPPIRRLSASADVSNKSPATRLLSRFNPFWIKIPLPRCERWIEPWARTLRPMFAGPALLIGSFCILIGLLVLTTHWGEFVASSGDIIHASNWAWLLGSWIALKFLHEMAHAIACNRAGGEVREAGVVLVLFAPLAYVDVTSCWRMNSRWSRIAVAAAGMYVELVIASVAVLLWLQVSDPHVKFLLHNLVFAAGLSTLLFNANALMRFDGYYILADLIEVPNLYSEATASLKRVAKRVVTGEAAESPGSLLGWRSRFVLGYGFAALLWRVVICVSLGIAASAMFAGAGVVIAAVGICIWLGLPLLQLRDFANDLRGRDPIRFVRAVLVGSTVLGLCCWTVFWLPIPSSVTVPAVTKYSPDTVVRSRATGFVTKIHVADGVQVREGDLILEIENRELTSRAQQLEITWKQNEIRLRQATDQHDAGASQIVRQNQKAIGEQLDQLRGQIAGLRVVAPRSGRVVARGLASILGRYVDEGQELLVIASESDKEVVAAIAQDTVREVRPSVGTKLRIQTASFDHLEGRLERIEPRASDHLPDRALAATEGGDLAVQAGDKQTDPDSYRLLEPHFRGRIGLSPKIAAAIPAGMRVQASFGYRTEPIAKRIRRAILQLWHSAQDDAAPY